MLYIVILLIVLYTIIFHKIHTVSEEIFKETASGGIHPTSVQNNVIYLLFVKSVNIIGYFLLDSKRA
jgi:hypothetical protein